MKKAISFSFLLFAAVTLVSCGSQGGAIGQNVLGTLLSGNTGSAAEQQTSTGGGLLGGLAGNGAGNVLGGLLSTLVGGSQKVTAQTIAGTWQYTGSACVFESENFLAQAGGMLAAGKIEKTLDDQLARFGIKPGACSFTFAADQTFTANIGGRALSGTYALDPNNNKITLNMLMGLTQLQATITLSGNQLKLLFQSDKLLKVASSLGGSTGKGALSSLTSLLKNYNGMLVGLTLTR